MMWKLQQGDSSLKKVRDHVVSQEEAYTSRVGFFYHDGLLYCVWKSRRPDKGDEVVEQLVLPKCMCREVFEIVHDLPVAGHLKIGKTKQRVLHRYYWPNVFADIAEYVCTCEACQQADTRCLPKAPLQSMPIMSEPFKRVAIDFVGP